MYPVITETLQETIERAMPLVNGVRELLHVPADEVKVVLEKGNEHIVFDNLYFVPFYEENKIIRWQLIEDFYYPGYFNPYDGGNPPDCEEIVHGEFAHIFDVLVECTKLVAVKKIAEISEQMNIEE